MEHSEFTRAYLEAMDFTELGEEGQPPVGARLSPYSLACALNDCSAFERAFPEVENKTQAGHDFWLTRQGHGTGFWDRDDDVYGVEMREMLTRAAKACGEVSEVDYGETMFGSLLKNQRFITKDGRVFKRWISYAAKTGNPLCKDEKDKTVDPGVKFEETVWVLP